MAYAPVCGAGKAQFAAACGRVRLLTTTIASMEAKKPGTIS
jgi:hypothetical protein